MTAGRYEQAMQGIESVFSSPDDIQKASDLTRTQKIELLNQWRQDLRQRITASGEGMLARRQGCASEILRQVENSMNLIRLE